MASPPPNLISPPEVEEVDYISHLLEALIHHIFSFLPFEDLVRTSTLSKQWRFACTSTPYINLSPSSEGVLPLISIALRLCSAKIEKFHLDATKLNNPAVLDWWFGFVAARKVEDASLDFGNRYHFAPRFLCKWASLVSLQVSKCRFSGDIIINWPSLKKLCLHDILLDNDRIMKILSGCPVLESLTLRCSRDWCEVRIDSRSLKELVIEAAYILWLNISAPNLLLLRLSGGFSLVGFRLKGASSLAEAELNFNKPTAFFGYHSDQLKFLLEQLQHVPKITIGSWCLEVLSAWEIMGMSYLSLRWRNIIVYTTLCQSDLLGMAYLLQSSPLLERLVICNPKSDNIMCTPYPDFEDRFDFDEKQLRRRGKESYCGTINLKWVEIVGFQFDHVKSKPLLALAKFLLEEAVGLEKMIIDAELRMLRREVPVDPDDLWGYHEVIHLQEVH